MQHECRITVLETKCFSDLQEQYLADPKSARAHFSNRVTVFCLSARRSRTISIT